MVCTNKCAEVPDELGGVSERQIQGFWLRQNDDRGWLGLKPRGEACSRIVGKENAYGRLVVHFEIGCKDKGATSAFYAKAFRSAMDPGPAGMITTGWTEGSGACGGART